VRQCWRAVSDRGEVVQFVGPTAVQNDIGLSFWQTRLAVCLRLRVVMRVFDAIDACMKLLAPRQYMRCCTIKPVQPATFIAAKYCIYMLCDC